MYKYILVFWAITVLSCKESTSIDISHIKSDVSIIRTETDILGVRDRQSLDRVLATHPAFYKLYMSEVLPVVKSNDADSVFRSFDVFVRDTVVRNLVDKVGKRYSDFSNLKLEIDQMYRHAKYYFPDQVSEPKVYTFVSDFAHQGFIFQDDDGRDGIALGLDMFMSPDIDYKMLNPDNTNFSDYVTRTWDEAHMVKKIADLHINEWIGAAPGVRLIDQMIHQGKALYVSKLLMPHVSDTIITEYTEKQLAWCTDNELQMWSFFFDQKLFYETNQSKIGKYIYPSPNSPDMPPSAPGRTASYIGWRVVKAYMDRYPETTIRQLIDMKDSQSLMDKSKYKPKQKK